MRASTCGRSLGPWTALSVIAVASMLALLGCGGSSKSTATTRAGAPAAGGPAPGSRHLVLLMMENKSYTEVVDSSNAPYINRKLIRGGRLFTKYYASFHPSLPNYLALTGGDTHGCTTDDCPRDSIAGENLFHQLDASRAGTAAAWKVYAEDMPSNCDSSASGQYAPRHNPAVYYTDLDSKTGDGSCAANDVPFTQLSKDIANRALPPFSVLVPNLYHDMHSDAHAPPCTVGDEIQDEVCQGDTWLSQQLPAVLSDGGRDDVTVILVWDEGETEHGGSGHVPMIEFGAGVPAGTRNSLPVGHFGLQNAIARWLGVAPLRPSVPGLS